MRVYRQPEAPVPTPRHAPVPRPRGLLALQAAAGNAAVTSLVVQRLVTVTGRGALDVRGACDLLADDGHQHLPFAAVLRLVQQAWSGTRADLAAAAGALGLGGPTIEDHYASLASNRASAVRGGAAPRLVPLAYATMSEAIRELDATGRAVDMDDVGAERNMPIGTASLATCIAVGTTFTDHVGARFTGLAHLTALQEPADVFAELEEKVRGLPACPRREQRHEVRYFVVGGSRDSVKLQVELLDFMIGGGFVGGDVELANAPDQRHRTKIVIVDRAGNVHLGTSTTDHAP